MATDDINVFGSIRDFIADQSMQAVERDRAKLEAILAAQEQFTPTPAQSAYLSAIFAPGSGIVDAAGQFAGTAATAATAARGAAASAEGSAAQAAEAASTAV